MFKKKKNKGSVVQGRNAIFVFKLFQIFCGDKTQKRKSKKIKKKGVETILFLVQKTISEDIEN